MGNNIIQKLVIPAKEARALKIQKGQSLRIIDLEGEQVADVVFYNADDYDEVFSVGHSIYLNMLEGIGDVRKLKKLWSAPPNEKVMLTVTDDPVGSHFVTLGTCCSSYIYGSLSVYGDETHPSCATNLMEALKPYGVPSHLPGVFNVFMNFDSDLWIKGEPVCSKVPKSKPGDYIDFKAEMNVLIGISACPSDKTPTNGYNPTSLGVEIHG